MSEKQLATANPVRSLIEGKDFKSAVAAALPQHLTPDRFVRIALTAVTRTPKLLECDRESVLKCMLQLSQFGLEPDGRLAHLIPFWNSQRKVTECQLIIDYKGLVDLAMRSGKVSYVHADKVCENDVFEWNKGHVTKHEINFKEDRGKPYAYYAIVKNRDGTEQAEAMTKAEVNAIRQRSRAKDAGPWVTDYDEMAKKTVFRRLSKWLQLSPEYRDALEADADALEESRFEAAVPITRAIIPKTLGEVRDSFIAEANGEQGNGGAEESPARPEAAPPNPQKPKLIKKAKPKSAKFQAEFEKHLFENKVSADTFLHVGRENNWIDESEDSLSKISEDKYEYFLQPDNLETILSYFK